MNRQQDEPTLTAISIGNLSSLSLAMILCITNCELMIALSLWVCAIPSGDGEYHQRKSGKTSTTLFNCQAKWNRFNNNKQQRKVENYAQHFISSINHSQTPLECIEHLRVPFVMPLVHTIPYISTSYSIEQHNNYYKIQPHIFHTPSIASEHFCTQMNKTYETWTCDWIRNRPFCRSYEYRVHTVKMHNTRAHNFGIETIENYMDFLSAMISNFVYLYSNDFCTVSDATTDVV